MMQSLPHCEISLMALALLRWVTRKDDVIEEAEGSNAYVALMADVGNLGQRKNHRCNDETIDQQVVTMQIID